MTDFQYLKQSAEQLLAFDPKKCGSRDEHYKLQTLYSMAFSEQATPETVLKLLDELAGYQQGAKVEADAADEARAEVRRLQSENEALRKDANLHAQLQRAAEVLPGAWNIQIVVERHAGWIEVFDDGGNRVAFDGEGHLGEQVSDALEMALAMAKEAGHD